MNQRCTVSLARYSVVKINEIIGQFEEPAIVRADDADAVSGILLILVGILMMTGMLGRLMGLLS